MLGNLRIVAIMTISTKYSYGTDVYTSVDMEAAIYMLGARIAKFERVDLGFATSKSPRLFRYASGMETGGNNYRQD